MAPSAAARLRLALLGRDLELRRSALAARLSAVASAAARRSDAFRRALGHLRALGNALNGTSVEAFGLEVLPRLVLSRAVEKPSVSLPLLRNASSEQLGFIDGGVVTWITVVSLEVDLVTKAASPYRATVQGGPGTARAARFR